MLTMVTLRNTTTAAIVIRALRDVQTVPPSKFVDGKKAFGSINTTEDFWDGVKDNAVVKALIDNESLVAEVPVAEVPVAEVPVAEVPVAKTKVNKKV